MTFDVTVREYPGKRLVGLAVRTSMEKAREDCPALWEHLMVCVNAMAGPQAYDAYGVSGDFAEDRSFVYWAALDAPADLIRAEDWNGLCRPTPRVLVKGASIVDLREGLYAAAAAPSLAALPRVYPFLYGEWPKTQAEYAVDFGAYCFEYYPKTWRENDPIQVCVPVMRTAAA